MNSNDSLDSQQKSRTGPPLTLLLWQDALLSWGIPLLLVGVGAVVTALGTLNHIAPTTAVTAAGWLLLLLIIFFPLKTLLTDTSDPRLKPLTWGFALAWIGVTWAQLYFTVFVGQEVWSGTISADNAGVTLSLSEQNMGYDLVIEGSFAATAGEGKHEADYRLALEKRWAEDPGIRRGIF
jgi:hypothetical protein